MFFLMIIMCGLAALYLGRHDAAPCDNFKEYGSTDKAQALFHRTNWKIKAVISIMASLPVLILGNWVLALFQGICSVCVMWPGFNIALNLARTNPTRPWYYLSISDSNNTDVWLQKIFKTDPGKKLTAVCLIVLISICVLAIVLYGKSYPDCFRLG